ncbi:MAG: alpha-N-arabinofuranosidase [Planctomycetes bacterium]|nr:alpha-N-arabinofuranosidase [Planctomycetota bacterium]
MARIKIDTDRVIGRIDPMIYGGFIEHLGRCIYGGIYEPGSDLADENGFRVDVLEALKALRMPALRWPGGNFVSGYHWMDGIGPAETRPVRMDLAWHMEEPNLFGTDEFIRFCRLLDTEPYICVNMGSGTMDEAQAWVEYCNGDGGTQYAELRRRNGNDDPFNVRFWGLGNEMYGAWQIGAYSDPAEYARDAVEFAKVMKWTDPEIKLIGCGRTGGAGWDSTIIGPLVQHIDYLSLHTYTGNADPLANTVQPLRAEWAIRNTASLIEMALQERNLSKSIPIAFDEWNVWYKVRDGRERGKINKLEEAYDLSDALAVAVYLNVFQRTCNVVGMANLAQMVNVIAPIMTRSDGLVLQTIYYPLQMYRNLSLNIALDAWWECDMAHLEGDRRFAGVPYLDVSVTRDEAGENLTVAIVNRSSDDSPSVTIEITGSDVPKQSAQAQVLNGPFPHAANTFDEPGMVKPRKKRVNVSGPRFRVKMPKFSLMVLPVRIGKEAAKPK